MSENTDPPTPPESVRITILMPADLLERVKERAAADDRSVSQFLRIQLTNLMGETSTS